MIADTSLEYVTKNKEIEGHGDVWQHGWEFQNEDIV